MYKVLVLFKYYLFLAWENPDNSKCVEITRHLTWKWRVCLRKSHDVMLDIWRV